jgi:hypothetical protein
MGGDLTQVLRRPVELAVHKRTPQHVRAMSALPPKADTGRRTDEVTLNETPKGVPFHPIEPPLQYVTVKP